MQRIAAFAALTGVETADGNWQRLMLSSRAMEDEPKLIGKIGETIQSADLLITYNGARHDLPVLRRRAMACNLFGSAPTASDFIAPRHFDLFDIPASIPFANRGSLLVRCASLGFDARVLSDKRIPDAYLLHKCETDVVAAFVLHLHELAAERHDPGTLYKGFEALRASQSGRLTRLPHLRGLMDRC